LGTLAIATLLPDLIFPSPDGRLWIIQWYDTFICKVHVDAPAQAAGAWSSWNMLNQGLAATIYRLTTPVDSDGGMLNVCLLALGDTARQRLTLALELLVLGWLAWCMWPRRTLPFTSAAANGTVPFLLGQESGRSLDVGLVNLTQVGMVVCSMLLLSPMSSSQHFGVLVVPISACATYWVYRRRDPYVAVALLAVFLFGALAARDLIGSFAVWPQAVGCKTWVAVALLAACGRVLLAIQKPSIVIIHTRVTSTEGAADEIQRDLMPKIRDTSEIDLFPVHAH
jgi:hypothetical protein